MNVCEKYLCRRILTENFSSLQLRLVLQITLIYRLSKPAGVFLNDFTHFLSSIIKLEKVLILGDFNFQIDDVSSNSASELLTITDSFNFEQYVSGSTHIKGHTLDLDFSLDLNVANVCVKSSQVKFICIAHFMYKTIQSALQK